MAIFKDKLIKCEGCGRFYESSYPALIRIPKDKDLKPHVLNADIHFHTCPNCKKETFSPEGLVYIDDEWKTIIIGNTYTDAIYDRIDFSNEFMDYKFYVTDELWTQIDIINAIDYGFDPLALEFLKFDFKKLIELKYKNLTLDHVSYEFQEDGYGITLVYIVSDIKGKSYNKSKPVPYEIYNKYVDKIEKFKPGMDQGLISETYVRKLYSLARNLEIEDAKSSIHTLFIVSDLHDELSIAKIDSFNKNKFKEGDLVARIDNEKKNSRIQFGKIEKIITMSDYEYYSSINDLPTVIYKIKDLEFDCNFNSNIVLNNEELKDSLIHELEDHKFDLFMNSNIIIPIKVLSEDNTMGYFQYNLKDRIYFPIYLDKNDIKSKSIDLDYLSIHPMKDALDRFFTVCYPYSGIIINPDTDKFVLSINNVLEIITNHFMTNSDSMEYFLKNASEDEIEYIGIDSYNIINMVYNTEMGLDNIRKDLNLTEKEADQLLNSGYDKIQAILRSKLLM